MAYPRDVVRLCDGGHRRICADCDPELDRAAAAKRRVVGGARHVVAVGAGLLPDLDTVAVLAGARDRFVVPVASDSSGVAGDSFCTQLASSSDDWRDNGPR